MKEEGWGLSMMERERDKQRGRRADRRAAARADNGEGAKAHSLWQCSWHQSGDPKDKGRNLTTDTHKGCTGWPASPPLCRQQGGPVLDPDPEDYNFLKTALLTQYLKWGLLLKSSLPVACSLTYLNILQLFYRKLLYIHIQTYFSATVYPSVPCTCSAPQAVL